ncbi:filamentous hemagglutinin N-terminal domain-containing protein [Leptolyngbya sp. 15MV]|nr:filamentous hemagglutinin N-terminal domain-containing protein [Leptolyngbya sp. 15MV]
MRARSRRVQGFDILPLPRGALLATTALQAGFALAFALPALAQPAPNARPQGGSVVAGQAAIGHAGNTTTITQSTDRAAINWQSFDIGAQQRVQFQQPGAGSVTLNRVMNQRPSEIAGQIAANGSVVLINPAGVVFHNGAQVEAQSFVASVADTTNAASPRRR